MFQGGFLTNINSSIPSIIFTQLYFIKSHFCSYKRLLLSLILVSYEICTSDLIIVYYNDVWGIIAYQVSETLLQSKDCWFCRMDCIVDTCVSTRKAQLFAVKYWNIFVRLDCFFKDTNLEKYLRLRCYI